MMSDKALPGDFTLLLLDAFHMEATELGSAKIALGLLKQKHFQRAADAFDELSGRHSAAVWLWICAGYCYLAADNLEEALHFLQTAVHRDPQAGMAHYCLGLAWFKNGDKGLARKSFSTARRLLPDLAVAALYEATVSFELNEFSQSLELLRELRQKYPRDPDLLNQLGLVLVRGFGKANEALELFREAIRLANGDSMRFRANEALTLRCLGKYAESIEIYDELIAITDDAYLRWQRGLAILTAGKFGSAWDDYGCRWILGESRQHSFDFEVWSPPPFPAETILVLSEQGIGDQILFSSCLPDLIAQTGWADSQIVLECNSKLEPLFRRSFPAAKIVSRNRDDDSTLKRAMSDTRCRQIFMGDLPRLYRRSAADFHGIRSFLKADAGRVRFWRTRLSKLGAGVKIGISWRGGLAGTNASLRTVDLREWLPILHRSDCHFVSLQYGDSGADIAAMEKYGLKITSWPEAIENFDETAALTASLDCIVSVCTSLVHLAGALGRPTAVLVPVIPEWVFGGADDTMPWYPSVTLFRQIELGEWGNPVRRVAASLSILLGNE